MSAEDYAVYAAILQGRGNPEDPEERWDDKTLLVIDDMTAGGAGVKENPHGWGWGFRSNSKQKPHEDTERDLLAKIDEQCPLTEHIDYAPGYQLISRKEVDQFFKGKGDGWQKFYEKYPKSSGIWGFSRVGFNSAGDEALTYVSHSCGYLCGTGHIYLLAKENGKWIVKNRVMLWIS